MGENWRFIFGSISTKIRISGFSPEKRPELTVAIEKLMIFEEFQTDISKIFNNNSYF